MKEVLKGNFREMVCKLCMSIFSSVNTSISMSLRPYSVRLSVRLSVCPSVCLFIYNEGKRQSSSGNKNYYRALIQ